MSAIRQDAWSDEDDLILAEVTFVISEKEVHNYLLLKK